MTPVTLHERRVFSGLLLRVYGLASVITGQASTVDQGVVGPVSKVCRCCRGGLFELAKEAE